MTPPKVQPVTPEPTIRVGNSDIVIQGLNEGERIRVKIFSLKTKSEVAIQETETAQAPVVSTKTQSKVSIDITPTLDSTLKKGAQIAVGGAKKNQRVRVTVK